jgi:hypothetical protein
LSEAGFSQGFNGVISNVEKLKDNSKKNLQHALDESAFRWKLMRGQFGNRNDFPLEKVL